MAIRIAEMKTALATTYGTTATWIGLATGDPGATTTPANEVTGGSPAYARKQTTWSAANPNVGSAVTIDSPAATISWIIVATAATVGTTNQRDNADVADVTLSGQGTIVVTPTYTQT